MLKVTLVGDEEMRAWARSAPGKLKGALAAGLAKAARIVVGNAKRIIYGGHPEHLQGDTGRLRNSLTSEVHGAQYAEVGTNVKYAKIHEFGGIIQAQGKALAIPVGDRKGPPGGQGDLKWAPASTSGGRLIDPSGNTQYLLVDEVVIPPRPYLGPAMEQSKGNVQQAFLNEVKTAMGKAAT